MKLCKHCGAQKLDNEFYNCKGCVKCKDCYHEAYIRQRDSGKLAIYNEINKDKIIQSRKAWYTKNRESQLQKSRDKWNSKPILERKRINKRSSIARAKRIRENPSYREAYTIKCKEYEQKNKDKRKIKRNKRLKNKYIENIPYRLEVLLRTAFLKAIKRKRGNKEKSIMIIIGCTQDELKIYLESKFRAEMTWDNYGIVWEIDHIIPIDSFNLIDIEQQNKCFHYSNLQPLFKSTKIAQSFGYNEIGNREKTDKII